MTYLNTGWAGPSPERVLDRMRAVAEEEAAVGPASPAGLAQREAVNADAREAAATLLNAGPASIVLTHGTTEGVNIVFHGIAWEPGDELVISSMEHPAINAPAAVLESRYGVKIVRASIAPGMTAGQMAQAVQSAVAPQTRLIALSHVLFTVGLRLPAGVIVTAAHEQGVPVLLDGAQTGGQIRLDMTEIGADFYTVSGQKWLMGPTGTGALYIAPERQSGLRPAFTQPGGDSRSGLAMFELTSGSTVLRAGFAEAIRLHLEIGPANVEERTRMLGRTLRDALRSIPRVAVIEPPSLEEATGLVTVALEGREPAAVVDALWTQQKVAARAVSNPAGVRFSTAPFNNEGDLKHAAAALSAVMEGP